jgi:hypothetical protein
MAVRYMLAENVVNELLFDQLLAGKEPGHSVSDSCMLMSFFTHPETEISLLNSSLLAMYSASMYLTTRCL